MVLLGAVSILAVSVVGCSSDTDESGSPAPMGFCDHAAAFSRFQSEAIPDLAERDRAPAFLAVSIEQLEIMAEGAPAEARDDVEAVAAGFTRLDAALRVVDYDLSALILSDYGDREANEAAERLDRFLAIECSLGANAPDPEAPLPFSPWELTTILDLVDAEEMTGRLVAQLVSEVGLTEEEASCLVDALGADAAPILLGERITDPNATASFADALADCAIVVEDLE